MANAQVIGIGSFGKVMLVRKKDSGRLYAMKILKKIHIVKRDEVDHTKVREVLCFGIQLLIFPPLMQRNQCV